MTPRAESRERRSKRWDIASFVLGPVLMLAFVGDWLETVGGRWREDFQILGFDVSHYTILVMPSPEMLFVIGAGLVCIGGLRRYIWR